MAQVNPGGALPDAFNPAAIAYARHQLMRLAARGLIPSLAAAAAPFHGDLTATWRAYSHLTGEPHTYDLGTGAVTAGRPIPPQLDMQQPGVAPIANPADLAHRLQTLIISGAL